MTSKNARGVKGNRNTSRFQGCVLLALFEVYIRYTARWLGCRVPFRSNIIIIIIIALLNYYPHEDNHVVCFVSNKSFKAHS